MKIIRVTKEYFQTEDETVYFFEPLEKVISIKDMQKIVDTNRKLLEKIDTDNIGRIDFDNEGWYAACPNCNTLFRRRKEGKRKKELECNCEFQKMVNEEYREDNKPVIPNKILKTYDFPYVTVIDLKRKQDEIIDVINYMRRAE